jgi:endonuclease YncB( thermonuclease family)
MLQAALGIRSVFPAAILVLAWAVDAGLRRPKAVSGRIVAVADGDTFTILDRSNKQRWIRPNGIDAPEKAQPFGL